MCGGIRCNLCVTECGSIVLFHSSMSGQVSQVGSWMSLKAHIVQVVCLEHCYLSRQLSVKAKFIIYYTIHGYRCHGFAFSTGIVLTLKRLHFSLAWYYHCTQYRLVPFTSLSLRPVIGVAAGKFQFVLRIRTVHQHIQTSCGKFDLQMR